ncbi:MAG: acetate--CoA ligase family protein [bacterium]|nr:acetate--CoA ligase family protein [bacterium]
MDLKKLFSPASIAIVGVSHDEKKVGSLVARNLLLQGYKGEVYYINKTGGTIKEKKVYLSLAEIKKNVDLVIFAVPGDVTISLIKDMKTVKAHHAVIYAAGFKETGKEGFRLEKKLIDEAKAQGVTFLGPNCIGYVNTKDAVNTTFLKYPASKGNIGFVSQSGALGSMLVDVFLGHINLGFSYFISIGNKTMLDEADILEYLLQDTETKVIGMYLEDIHNPEKLKEILRNNPSQKPIIVLKSGRTSIGSRAAVSHTGGLIGDDDVYSAFFSQCNIIRADTIDEFITILSLYSFGRIPLSRSILVLSNAGGAGVLLTDELIKNNLELITVSEATKNKIIRSFGASKKVTINNPIDILGDASAFDYKEVIDMTLTEKDVGAIVVLLTPQANTEIKETAEVIQKAQSHFDRPIYPIFMGDVSVAESVAFFEKNTMVSFTSIGYFSSALRKIRKQQEYGTNVSRDKRAEWVEKKELDRVIGLLRKQTEAHEVFKNEQKIGKLLSLYEMKDFVPLDDSMKIMELAGISSVPLVKFSTKNEIQIKESSLLYPVVAKIISDSITHKTEVKGVITHIHNSQELETAFTSLSERGSKGCFVQKQIDGHEIFIGVKRDAQFGVVAVAGLGGIFAELLQDVCYLIHPFTIEEFEYTVRHTKIKKLEEGFRGKAPLNLKYIYEPLVILCSIMETFPQIKSIDVNPLLIQEKSSSVIDGRIVFV